MCVSTDIGLYAADHRCRELSAEGCRRALFRVQIYNIEEALSRGKVKFFNTFIYLVVYGHHCGMFGERTNERSEGLPSANGAFGGK